MKELIKITEKDGKKAVNARELHAFLGVGKDFSSWIKDRIAKYEFIDGLDFEVFTNSGENSNGGRPSIDYALSIDMAKELSMVENNEKGRLARKYFIECEKQLRYQKPSSLLEDKIKAATWVVGFLNMNDVSKLQLAKSILEPLGLPSPDYVQSKGVMHSASELLRKNNIQMSALKFNSKLVAAGILKEATRQGKTKLHKFKVITDKGLTFGENQVSPKNPQETQPRWYDDKFAELLKAI